VGIGIAVALNQNDLITLYRGLAGRYDLTTNLYRVMGFPMGSFRKAAVGALSLRAGDSVVELGCGTGLNFPLLQQAIGPSGKIIGVDMTDAMLAKAQDQIDRRGWRNVELVHSDVAQYEFKRRVDGILSTFAMEFVAEYDDLIRRCSAALNPGKHLAIADLKIPDGRLAHLAPLLLALVRPYGTTMDLADRRSWESVVKYLNHTTVKEFYFGYAYLAWGRNSTGTG
jgi:demethylmenaquinone methyltransferase/2-methoxy-6-polyprenyl-1,4-benzoquinol methylase